MRRLLLSRSLRHDLPTAQAAREEWEAQRARLERQLAAAEASGCALAAEVEEAVEAGGRSMAARLREAVEQHRRQHQAAAGGVVAVAAAGAADLQQQQQQQPPPAKPKGGIMV